MRLLRCLALAAVAGCHAAPPAAAPGQFDLVVATTTDVHGRLRGWDYERNVADPLRGLSRAATIVDSVRAANAGRVVLVDAGDLLQGNQLAYVAARVSQDTASPIVAAMNAMAYDAAALGNHEFNYGLAALDRAIGQARFPFLSANAFRPSGERAYRPWTIVTRGPVRVGIVGATTPGVTIWDRDNVAGRIVFRDIVPEVRRAVAEVRAAGADVVVVTVHTGLSGPSSYDTVATGVPSENVAARVAREVEGIALVAYGHSHREMRDTVIGSTMLIQARNWATSVGVAHLGLAREGAAWRVVSRRGDVVRAEGHAESPALLAATEGAHRATVAYVTAPIGSTPVAWRADSARVADTPLVDLILEVERRATGADLASTAAFSLDAALGPGPITRAALAGLYPYDNTLRAVRISGRQLREYLEFSARYYRSVGPDGATPLDTPLVDPAVPGYNFDIVAGADYALDLRRPAGSRLTRLAVRGRAVVDADSFTLALNNYRQTGGGGYAMLQGAPVVHDRGVEIRQLLIEEVERRGTIRPEDYFVRNWSLEPPPAVAAAYAAHRRQRPFDAAAPRPRDPGLWRVPPTRLRIIATNDFHGALEPRPDSLGVPRGGAGQLATAIRRAAAECAPPSCVWLLVDGGDMFQGTPASNASYGRAVVALFDSLGYAAAAVGNHEFDWGLDTLRARMRDARYAILAANVRDTAGRDVSWIRDDTLVERGGLRVGIIGLAHEATARLARPSFVRGLRFDPAAPIVDSLARGLRARGADVVVVIGHVPIECDSTFGSGCTGPAAALAAAVAGRVDAIVSGHSHAPVAAMIAGVPVVQARSSARAVGVIDLPVGGRDGAAAPRVEVRTLRADTIPSDPAVGAMTERWTASVSEAFARPVATVAERLLREMGPQTALGNLIADSQRSAGAGDVAVMNTGGIRTDLPAGLATRRTLYEILPFENRLVRFRVTGAALRRYLEQIVTRAQPNAHVSGVRVEYDPRAPRGARVRRATLAGGRALDDAATYTIVINDFMAEGGDGLALAGAAVRADTLPIGMLDALADHLRALPQPVRYRYEPRLVEVR
ncbi:MAG TPA: 5'-nucleotidase C-terminal domain-containing protein [Gemmatimonadaceae bacterium]|nr:5'-nucleotidase C-terminal domain-containing protein [Gemmatimonadaceae bacterium]